MADPYNTNLATEFYVLSMLHRRKAEAALTVGEQEGRGYRGDSRSRSPLHPGVRDPPCLLLRFGTERRGEEYRARASEERAAVYHWMISSARCRSGGGIVRPRALAVFRLMTSSNLVGCSTGRSAGLAPLRILST